VKKKKPLPVRKVKCATCPYREGGYVEVQDLLSERALKEGTPICHSTGGPQAVVPNNLPSAACRGARDLQLQFFCAIGFLSEPTDAAWAAKAKELRL